MTFLYTQNDDVRAREHVNQTMERINSVSNLAEMARGRRGLMSQSDTKALRAKFPFSLHPIENYGGLEKTRTSDLFRVNMAKALLLLLFPPK
jgi:hypothetical protein